MNNSALDDHIKERFGNYSPDVPPHIWENIVAEKDKRRPGIFWLGFLNKKLALLLLGVLVAGAGIFIYKNTSSPSNKNNEHVIAEGQPTSKTTNNTVVDNISSQSNTELSTTTENVPATTNPVNNTADKSISTIQSTSTGKDKETIINKNNIVNKDLTQDIVKTNKNKKTASLASTGKDNNENDITADKRSKQLKGSSNISFRNAEAIADEVQGTNENELLMNRYLLSLDMIRSQKNSRLSIKKINNPHLDIPCPEAEKNAAGNKRYFELYGSADYAFRSISDTGNSAYLQKRKESTTFSSAFSAGLRYTRVFGNGMSFRTGVNYSQINEKFKFAQGNIVQVVYVIDSNGDTTGSYTTTGTRYKTTYNRFRTIDIPILVGYELGNGRLHVNFNAGAVVNLYSWQKGDVLDTTYQPISITTGKTNSPYQFKTNVGIGFMGAVSVYYKLTDKWHIFAEPYYRYNFTPASKSDLTLKQKYNTAGLKLGVRLDF